MKSTQPEKKDYCRSVLYLLIYVIVISGGAFLLLPDDWYLWGILVVGGLVLLVNWHRRETVYQCPNCKHIYQISFCVDLLAPHGVDREGAWLFLRCPNCKQRHKTKVLKRVDPGV